MQQTVEMCNEITRRAKRAGGVTPLMLAAAEGAPKDVLTALIVRDKNLEAGRKADNSTALKIAAEHGQRAALETLVKHGARVDATDKLRRTPLMAAADNGHCNAVDALLGHGADPCLCSGAGWNALMFACRWNTGQLFLSTDAWIGWTSDSAEPPRDPAKADKIQIFRSDVLKGLPHDQFPIVQRLCADARLDINQQTNEGTTALMIACWAGSEDVVELLLNDGADPNRLTDSGVSALMIACYRGHRSIVERILEAGGDIDHQKGEGWDFVPVENIDWEADRAGWIHLKLEQYLDFNKALMASRGITALYAAAQGGHREVFTLLQCRGASAQTQCARGDTPERAARRLGWI